MNAYSVQTFCMSLIRTAVSPHVCNTIHASFSLGQQIEEVEFGSTMQFSKPTAIVHILRTVYPYQCKLRLRTNLFVLNTKSVTC